MMIKKLKNVNVNVIVNVNVPRKALVTIYKSFIRPHFDYGDILYDKPEN